MYAFLFLLAAIGFAALSIFVFLNYPASWRKDRLFVTLLGFWHVVGTVCIIITFTAVGSRWPENIRYEICRLATFFYVSTMLLAIMFFFRMVYSRTYQFILRNTGRETESKNRRIANQEYQTVFFILLSFGICTAGYFNIDFLRLQSYEVEVSAQSAESELRVCLIADIHAGSGTWQYTYDDLAEQIDAADADVLLIAGDLFDETTGPKDVDNFMEVLRTIRRPRYGIYYIYGNHDGLMEDWVPGAREKVLNAGVTVLADEMITIGEDIQLIGCLDPSLHAEKLDALFERLHPDPDKPIILATHRPNRFRQMASLGVDLAVAGHTHGFNIPQFLGNVLGYDMLGGSRKFDGMTAVTTSGVSAWGFHYKWPAQSEVVSIRLHFTPEGEQQ